MDNKIYPYALIKFNNVVIEMPINEYIEIQNGWKIKNPDGIDITIINEPAIIIDSAFAEKIAENIRNEIDIQILSYDSLLNGTGYTRNKK